MLTGGMSTFTCQVYHVQTNEQKIDWGTSTPIEIRDFFLGGKFGLKTSIRGAAAFRVRFNINEDDEACKKTFMRLMGDKSTYTVTDLGILFEAEIGQKISSVVGKELENMTRQQQSIDGISSQLEDFSIALKPRFDELFATYGLEVINFSFYNLNVDEDDTRKELMDRLVKGVHASTDVGYNMAMQQELLENISVNPGAGGIASAGAGLGMGMAAGNAFAQMATTAFSNPQPQQAPQPQGFGGQGRFGTGGAPQQQPASAQPDPMESLSKMKQLLDAGLIKQEQYDAKVAEIMSRL
jgi:membrane protease subunit (stomatin/prohibitin family)